MFSQAVIDFLLSAILGVLHSVLVSALREVFSVTATGDNWITRTWSDFISLIVDLGSFLKEGH